MSDLSTALRAFFTRRLDLSTISSYVLLVGLLLAVVLSGSLIVAGQLSGL
jgi:hypothetical protein